MADPDGRNSDDENKEYKIRRRPDLQVVTTGAQIHYSCDWIAPGERPTVASDNYCGPADGIRWYSTATRLRPAGSRAFSTTGSSKAR